MEASVPESATGRSGHYHANFEAPRTIDVPWPRFVERPAWMAGLGPAGRKGEVSSPSSSSVQSAEEIEGVEFWLGPNEMPGKLSFAPHKLGFMREGIDSAASCGSSNRSGVRLSDFMRVRQAAPDGVQLSAGSALHVGDGSNSLCLICSYHKPPLRYCKKGEFCDYCHLHDGRRNKKRRPDDKNRTQRLSWAETEIPVLRGIDL
mmetsp:Transcript_60303/g.140935  ORF Transcript_60303/g.140935 Transcript_60303/m.140935 type:complete len:204 (-) Transcript_60303:39-650(-)